MIDGGDVFDYQLNISSSLAQYNEGYCCIGGGVVCNITLERHIKLVNADKISLKWRLGSLYVLDGECESLPLSLPPSLPSSLPSTLPPSLPPSLPSTLPPSLSSTFPPSLPPSLPSSLSPFLPPSLPPSIDYCLWYVSVLSCFLPFIPLFSFSLSLSFSLSPLGSFGVSLASLLYQLGPETPPSSIAQLGDILTSSYVEMAFDATAVNQSSITEAELQAVQVRIHVVTVYI